MLAVETLALRTVFEIIIVTAAISTVPVAATVVIVVVTVVVSFVLRLCTRFFALF